MSCCESTLHSRSSPPAPSLGLEPRNLAPDRAQISERPTRYGFDNNPQFQAGENAAGSKPSEADLRPADGLSATGVRDREVVRYECACITGVSQQDRARISLRLGLKCPSPSAASYPPTT